MLKGIKLKANPTNLQKEILSQWMGCARFIWNAKCEEESYYRSYARKYCPVGTYAPIDAKAAHFKDKTLSPWLYQCPSQIIRNAATNWYKTYMEFVKGKCGRPKRKRKTDKGSIYLTRELFSFDQCDDGVTRLFIGTKTNNIGYLSFKAHAAFSEPNSLYIRKEAGVYTVSFCYETDEKVESPLSDQEQLTLLGHADQDWLESHVVGIDRGVKVPVHTGTATYDYTEQQKRKAKKRELHIKRAQKRLSRQLKGSNRRSKTKMRLAKQHKRVANIRQDFCHKISRALVNSDAQVIVFENLKTAQMTRRSKPKQDDTGKYLPNRAKQKSGLNKRILNVGWHYLECCTQYKAKATGKAVFKIASHFTSQACSS